MPLLVAEPMTGPLQHLHERDPAVLVWWATEIECVSALGRLERKRHLTQRAALDAFARLDALRGAWNEVQPVEAVRMTARRLLRVHPMRAADSLQLAAALVAAEGQPSSVEMVALDDRLLDAARREGMAVADLGNR